MALRILLRCATISAYASSCGDVQTYQSYVDLSSLDAPHLLSILVGLNKLWDEYHVLVRMRIGREFCLLPVPCFARVESTR